MKYLVTGGAGFIGSNLVEELLRRGESVRVLDNFSTGKHENLIEFKDRIELIEGDIRSYHIVWEAVAGVDVILHEAALPSVPRSIRDPITTNEVNVGGTLNILDAARDAKVKRVVFASSSSVYGDNPELPKHEGMIPNPLSPYAVSKLAGEKYCSVFSRIYGLETIALRYFNVFGPRQDPNSQYSAVIPKFITAILNNQQPIIYGDGEQSRDFTFVANVIEANVLAATTTNVSGIAVNCACHGRISLNELALKVNEILGKNVQPIYKEERVGDIKHSFANIDASERHLGYKPVINFDTGLKKTIEWYKEKLF
ncbi:MAG: SDR family oxidoreductase [Bacteroidota bacterium]|nr:SDR family oxidoreductase [Bacteroidota bacterium]